MHVTVKSVLTATYLRRHALYSLHNSLIALGSLWSVRNSTWRDQICNPALKPQSLRNSIVTVLCFSNNNRYSEEDNDQNFQEVKRNERKKKRQRVRLHLYTHSPCEVVLWILYIAQCSRNPSSTTSMGSVSHQQQSSSSVGIGNSSNGSSSISFAGGRYHHREVPPRFQHHKQNKGPKHSSKSNQGIYYRCFSSLHAVIPLTQHYVLSFGFLISFIICYNG